MFLYLLRQKPVYWLQQQEKIAGCLCFAWLITFTDEIIRAPTSGLTPLTNEQLLLVS